MKRKLALIGLACLVIFMILPNVGAVPRLEFIDVPTGIKLEDSFTFSVQLTDARYYDYFSLYGETPSGEEMYFGEHFFDEGLWFQYTNEWTLTFSSFNETGYYTLSVDAGAVNDPDVDMMTTSCSIYVVRTVTTTFPPPGDAMILVRLALLFLVIGGVLVMLVYIIRRRKRKK